MENTVQERIKFLESKIGENGRNLNTRKQEEEENNIKVNKIVDKWLNLQKIIKEEITLREIIKNQKEEHQKQLKINYKDYYQAKLLLRQISENIISINGTNDTEKKKNFVPDDNPELTLCDAYDPIKNLFNLFRINYDYVVILISIIGDNEEIMKENKEVLSIIDLFCHQFYDNILIPNPEQEELLILIYLLLEKEINSMNSASVASFLDDNYSIIGKFLKSYTKKPELKNYLSNTLGSLILSIENEPNSLDLNISIIKNTIDTEKKYNNISKKNNSIQSSSNDIFEENLTKDIPKCRINLDKRINELSSDSDDDDNDEADSNIINDNSSTSSLNNSYRKMSIEMNNDYSNEINQKNLNERINNEKDPNLKEFFIMQLERINKDPNIFTNKKFLKSLNFAEQNEILTIYKRNFLRIQEYIDLIIQSLIDKISAIPYPLRSICKLIYMLIKKKFPNISIYETNAFVGEFIFGKCILPILINSDRNAIITSTILSQSTRTCLTTIAKVLSKINRGMFFESNLETENTIFNHYIIEVIPIINQFYERIIDIQLPKTLDKLVEEHMKIPNISIIKQTHMRQSYYEDLLNNKDSSPQISSISPSYDYFSQNPDELINIQCMCFSLEDILFILKILKQNKNKFSHLEKFNFFCKTIEKISVFEPKLYLANQKNPEVKPFFLLFNTKEKEIKILNDEENINYSKLENDQDSNFILKRIIFCIKTVLSGLNLLNNKDYPYLNIANTTNKFFSSLKHTLEDYGEFPDGKNEIPLKWYSQYISNNKKMLDKNLRKNDYEKFYKDLYEKEVIVLKDLKNFSSELNTRNGLNKRCAEKIIEKAKIDLNRMKVIEKFLKIEYFIEKTKIEAFIEFKNDSKKVRFSLLDKLKQNKNEDINGPAIIIRNDVLEIEQLSYFNKIMEGKSKKELYMKRIKDFIKIFSENPWKKNINNYPLPRNIVLYDIENGVQNSKISETISQYLSVVKQYLEKDIKFNSEKDNGYVHILDSIENHIQKNIYSYVFPKDYLINDIQFYEQTVKLSWITPENLDIKKIFVNELKYAENLISQMDSKKTCYEKLNLISEVYNTINNTIKFSTGKRNEDAGADDLAPIFQYIIIKSKPKKFYSNIFFIKCFIRSEKLKGIYGFLLTQLEFAAQFIINIDNNKVKLSEIEFNEKKKKAWEKETEKVKRNLK